MKVTFFLSLFLFYFKYVKHDTIVKIIDNVEDLITITYDSEDVGEPLILTSFLEKGLIKEARQLALVNHYEIPGIKSYSGLLTVNKEYNSNLFFWYFPARMNRENAPIILWMTGGPGSTSMLGLFAESGPFTVTVNQTVETREYTWIRNHHMLYLDSPVDAGYSFTDNTKGFAKTSEDVARDVITALEQFYRLFPELQNNPLYVIGESMAGKFSPPVVHAIKEFNQKAEIKINVNGLIIAGGVADPVNQIKHCRYMYELGLIDSDELQELQTLEDKIIKLIEDKKFILAINQGTKYYKRFMATTGFEYFFHSLRPKEPDYINPFIHWVVRPDVRKAIHVGNITFERSSNTVKTHIIRDMFLSVAHYIEEALEDMRVLVYTGQLDFMLTNAAMENFISKLSWSEANKYKAASKQKYYVDGELAGYVKSAGNMTSILIRNSGHMLPNDQPVWAWDMMTRFTHNLEYPTNKSLMFVDHIIY